MAVLPLKEPNISVLSGQDTSVCRLKAGAAVMGRAQAQGALPMQEGTSVCHTPTPLLGSLLWRRFGGGCATQHLQALPTEHAVVPQLVPGLYHLPAVQLGQVRHMEEGAAEGDQLAREPVPQGQTLVH